MPAERPLLIIGGGATAAWLLIMLRRRLGRLPPTVVVEPRATLGLGLAYSTGVEAHCLNVTADKMDMHPVAGVPDFVGWLAGAAGLGQADYAPRALYGRYLAELLQRELRGQPVTHRRTRVVDLQRAGDRFTATLAEGAPVRAANVVLALGNPPSRRLWQSSSPCVIEQPLQVLPGGTPGPRKILVVGAGLTAMDIILEATARWPDAAFTVVAPHPFFPPADRPVSAIDVIDPDRIPGPADIWRMAKRQRRGESAPLSWLAPVDGLRPHTASIWQAWPTRQRRSFLRHASRYWLHLRHRAAPQAASAIEALGTSDRLRLVGGRARLLEVDEAAVRVALGAREATYDLVINATGPDLDPASDPLLARLLEQGLIARDSFGLGLRAADDGTVLDGQDRRVEGLSIHGVWTRGTFWEVVAIPHVRERLAASLPALERQLARNRSPIDV